MKSTILCRVSSKEQEETGYSLPAQEELLTKYALKRDLNVCKVFSISESASGQKQRAIFDEMMSYIRQNNVKVLIVEKVDRLTRNFKDMVMIDEWLEKDAERQVHLVKDSLIMHKNSRSQENLNWGIRVLFAKNQIDNLSEEVKKGQAQKLKDGWLPTEPPSGYISSGDKGRKIYLIDKQTAPLVREMFQLYGSGMYSLKKLTETMKEKGLRNKNDNPHQRSRIHTLLSNPFYIGKNRWNGLEYQGKQELFIDGDLFNKVQLILKSKTTPKYRKHVYLFSGFIHCRECSGTITWELQKGTAYGHCNHYRNCSQKLWPKEYEIESQIQTILDKLAIKNRRIVDWVRKALKEYHKDHIEASTVSHEALSGEIERIERRMDNLYEDKLDERITQDFYDRKFKQYSDELEKTKNQLDVQTDDNKQYYQLGLNFYEISQKGGGIYKKAKKEQKRSLIKLVFKELWLDEGVLTYRYNKAFEILSGIAVELNSSKVAQKAKRTEKIFEQSEKVDTRRQMDIFYAQRPVLLPRLDSNQQPFD